MSSSAKTVDAVKNFWEGHVNNEYYTKHERGSAEYFREIERRRYRYHYHLPELFEHIGQHGVKGKSLLEIGCGIGIDTRQLARLGLDRVVAVDLTEAAVEIARKRFAEEGVENTRFMVGNAENLELEEDSFDYVYSFGVIHHTPRIASAIAEIRRVLKPGGKAFIMIYHSRSLVDLLHRMFRIPYESFDGGDAPVTDRFSRQEARALFADYTDVQVHTDYPFTYGMRAISRFTPIAVQRALGRRIGWHLMIEARKPMGAPAA